MDSKKCKQCGENKSLDEFYVAKLGKLGREARCKPCHNERYDTKAHRKRRKLKEYGLTVDQYEELKKRQNSVCAICGKGSKGTRELAVDHDHSTGRVRGLLCLDCNTALGKFEDNVELLVRAITYLKIHSCNSGNEDFPRVLR